jgi:hypothetical protein
LGAEEAVCVPLSDAPGVYVLEDWRKVAARSRLSLSIDPGARSVRGVNSHNSDETDTDLRGHNVRGLTVAIEVRLFNSLHRYGGIKGAAIALSLPAGSSVGDILQKLAIPADKVFLALRNGRDITPGLHTKINTEAALDEGDVIALSGPVPYSWGYGSPVV